MQVSLSSTPATRNRRDGTPPRRGRSASTTAVLAAVALASAAPAAAQSYSQFVAEANRNTIAIVSGSPGETSLEIAQDLSTVLHCVDGLRVIPMAGRGDAHNIYDLLFLRGVDMAIVRADVLDYLNETETYISNLKERVRYVAPLFEQEIHLIAGEDIKSIQDLQGKLVNIGSPGQLALGARRLLEAAGVTVIESKFDSTLALERVIDGGLDAMFITGGKPIPLLAQMGMVSGLHLVSLSPPAEHRVYRSAEFTYNDYPSLVAAGESVQTISVPSVLAVYRWDSSSERYEKNKLFTDAFFRRAGYLRRPARHPKWRDAPLVEEVPGWSRFEPAAEIVARMPKPAQEEPLETNDVAAAAPSPEALKALFEQQLEEFGITPQSEEEREQLFLAFRRRVEATR